MSTDSEPAWVVRKRRQPAPQSSKRQRVSVDRDLLAYLFLGLGCPTPVVHSLLHCAPSLLLPRLGDKMQATIEETIRKRIADWETKGYGSFTQPVPLMNSHCKYFSARRGRGAIALGVWQFGKWELFWHPSSCYAVRIIMSIVQHAHGNSLAISIKDRVAHFAEDAPRHVVSLQSRTREYQFTQQPSSTYKRTALLDWCHAVYDGIIGDMAERVMVAQEGPWASQ